MAKKAKAPAESQMTCAGYKLTVENSNDSFIFQLDVVGSDGKQYSLFVETTNDRPGTVQKVLRIIADRWPAFAFQFQADDNQNIMDAS